MINGKFGISAKVVADSVSEAGVRLTTMEIEYPRLILSELNTHRMLSKNSASSRAIPFAKMKEQLTGRPVRFGQANPGMQDKGHPFDSLVMGELPPETAWECAKSDALVWSKVFHEAGYHKQVYNRLTEPFQMMKTVISGTEWNNFFWLRDDSAADPTIAELARCIREAQEASTPILLGSGEFHLPYVASFRQFACSLIYYTGEIGSEDYQRLSIEDAIKMSCARSAAVSFRNNEYGIEKCREVYDRLVGDDRKHASALEHAATPIEVYTGRTFGRTNDPRIPNTWQDGISHADRDGQLWSGNFRGFVQHRKTIAGENYV